MKIRRAALLTTLLALAAPATALGGTVASRRRPATRSRPTTACTEVVS
ncbi:MAG: hypothetical protein M3022_17140 [Actinomycetota bacterium]|nr:hypothetical protein [Actinomycetota bacterium]